MIREIRIVQVNDEELLALVNKYFGWCAKNNYLPLKVEFGAIVAEKNKAAVGRMLLKGYADDDIKGGFLGRVQQKGGEEMAGDNKQLNNVVAKAKEVGRYMLTITTLKPDGTMEHDFVMQNFPTGEMLNSSFEHERLVRKEKNKIDHM